MAATSALHCTKENGYAYVRHEPKYVIECDISANKICDVINVILMNYCKVDTCGYNKSDDEYWGKKNKKNICELYFHISIKNLGENNSVITIIPTIGTQQKINELCMIISEVVSVCEMWD